MIVHTEFERTYANSEVHPVEQNSAQEQHENIFDGLTALLAPAATELRNDLDRYLSADVENVRDPISWCNKRRSMYPRLLRMALDYLSIPGKCFSHHRLPPQLMMHL